ncbi:MAG: DUF523 and DUF1722 domain-containing protein [Candidatus Binataceae bacterium]|jgi:uncharacterized protein YbgA (DUF1722 family)/uncharacterized protein YbbK (DUF523 family)
MASAETPTPADAPIRIGISACLLGQEVRFDGGHKRSDFLVDIFGPFVEFVPVCPEVEIGLGVPRETLRLVRDGDEVRLLGNKSGANQTDAMRRYSDRRTATLANDDLSGYVLKKDSPSCGMERVRIYAASGIPARDGRGLYADALMRRFPNLPIEEEGRLNDARLRDNFIERVFAYRRLRTFFAGRWTTGGLVALHTAHKLQLLAHAPRAYAELGRMVANAASVGRGELRDRYETEFMGALKKIATPARQVNVLQHMAGYFRDRLDPESRRELAAVIEDYRAGLVPLIVPITLVRHHVRTLDIGYLKGQVYLEPHPKELMLRNHV